MLVPAYVGPLLIANARLVTVYDGMHWTGPDAPTVAGTTAEPLSPSTILVFADTLNAQLPTPSIGLSRTGSAPPCALYRAMNAFCVAVDCRSASVTRVKPIGV